MKVEYLIPDNGVQNKTIKKLIYYDVNINIQCAQFPNL